MSIFDNLINRFAAEIEEMERETPENDEQAKHLQLVIKNQKVCLQILQRVAETPLSEQKAYLEGKIEEFEACRALAETQGKLDLSEIYLANRNMLKTIVKEL